MGDRPPSFLVGDANINTIMEKENKRGGKREGSGRKSKNATSLAFRLNNDLLALVVQQAQERGCTKTDVIEDALKSYFKIN